MRFAKHVCGDVTQYVRIKRRGTKNCRVVSLETGEERLVPKSELVECSAADAGMEQEAETATDNRHTRDNAVPPTATAQDQLTGEELRRLMRNYQATIKDVAARLGISEQQVRVVRREGLRDAEQIEAWTAAIVGEERSAA